MRGFDEGEREEIREGLVDAGEEHFLRAGPRKTTIEDLTDEVGIAKGSFYTFFDSKGELFLQVFVRLRDELVAETLEAVSDVEDGREGIRRLLHTHVEWLEDNPIIQKLASDVDQTRFERSLPADGLAAAERERIERLGAIVRRWQANGTLRDDVPPDTVVGLLEPLTLLVVDAEEYDDEYHERRDFLIETLSRGLEP